MKLETAYRDPNTGSMFLSWSEAPLNTTYFSLELAYSTPTDGADWIPVGTTTNTFMSDYMSRLNDRFFEERYYRLRALDGSDTVLDELLLPDNVKNERPIVDHSRNLLLYSARIVLRNKSWAYDAFIVKPRKTGTACECYNSELRASTDPDCEVCHGTGFVGGYYSPIPTRVKIHDEQIDQATANAPIPTSYDMVRFVVPTIVKVFPKDYLVVPDLGYRFVCTNSNVDSVVAVKTATQMTQFSRLDLNDTFYKYDIGNFDVSISSVTYTSDTITVTGENVFPLFGHIKLVFGKKDDLDGIVLSHYDLISSSNTSLVFQQNLSSGDDPIDFVTDFDSYEYRLILNIKFFDGTATQA